MKIDDRHDDLLIKNGDFPVRKALNNQMRHQVLEISQLRSIGFRGGVAAE